MFKSLNSGKFAWIFFSPSVLIYSGLGMIHDRESLMIAGWWEVQDTCPLACHSVYILQTLTCH